MAARRYSRIERYHCHSRSSLKPNHHHEHKMDSTHSARATHGRHDKHEACSTGCHSIRPHERNSTEQTLSLPFQQRQRPDTCHSIRPHERNRYTIQSRLRACPSSGSSVRISLHGNNVTRRYEVSSGFSTVGSRKDPFRQTLRQTFLSFSHEAFASQTRHPLRQRFEKT